MELEATPKSALARGKTNHSYLGWQRGRVHFSRNLSILPELMPSIDDLSTRCLGDLASTPQRSHSNSDPRLLAEIGVAGFPAH
jgi:hypothetical protein